ncbi:MAG TPA: hypothetical protein VN132_05970, partial [Bdellovibrio sp.]|nr:hypothetical protein [Bdellovibrio sp.]
MKKSSLFKPLTVALLSASIVMLSGFYSLGDPASLTPNKSATLQKASGSGIIVQEKKADVLHLTQQGLIQKRFQKDFLKIEQMPNPAKVMMGGAGNTGGGGPIVTEPVSIADFRAHLENALVEIRPVLYGFKRQFDHRDPEMSIVKVAFDGKTSILDILPRVTIELRENSPCYDKDGADVEASVVMPIENQICISYLMLKTKLDQWTYRQQLSALLLHEISHLAGTDEAQARALQGFVLGVFLKLFEVGSNKNELRHASTYMTFEIDSVMNSVRSIEDDVRKSKFNPDWSLKQFSNIGRWLNESLQGYLDNFPVPLVSEPTSRLFRKHMDDLYVVEDYLRTDSALPPNITPDLLIASLEAFKSDLITLSKNWQDPEHTLTPVTINQRFSKIRNTKTSATATLVGAAKNENQTVDERAPFTTVPLGSQIFEQPYVMSGGYPSLPAGSDIAQVGGLK